MGCAVHGTLPPGVGYATASLRRHYVRGLTPRSGPLLAEGRVVHADVRRRVPPSPAITAPATTIVRRRVAATHPCCPTVPSGSATRVARAVIGFDRLSATTTGQR